MKSNRNVTELCSQLKEYFSPKIIGEVNDVYIKITKTKGQDVPWHTHDNEDEMFYIIKGTLEMEVENTEGITLNNGDFYIVNKGVRHRVYSDDDCWMMLIENKSTLHTGSVQSKITRSIDEQH